MKWLLYFFLILMVLASGAIAGVMTYITGAMQQSPGISSGHRPLLISSALMWAVMAMGLSSLFMYRDNKFEYKLSPFVASIVFTMFVSVALAFYIIGYIDMRNSSDWSENSKFKTITVMIMIGFSVTTALMFVSIFWMWFYRGATKEKLFHEIESAEFVIPGNGGMSLYDAKQMFKINKRDVAAIEARFSRYIQGQNSELSRLARTITNEQRAANNSTTRVEMEQHMKNRNEALLKQNGIKKDLQDVTKNLEILRETITKFEDEIKGEKNVANLTKILNNQKRWIDYFNKDSRSAAVVAFRPDTLYKNEHIARQKAQDKITGIINKSQGNIDANIATIEGKLSGLDTKSADVFRKQLTKLEKELTKAKEANQYTKIKALEPKFDTLRNTIERFVSRIQAQSVEGDDVISMISGLGDAGSSTLELIEPPSEGSSFSSNSLLLDAPEIPGTPPPLAPPIDLQPPPEGNPTAFLDDLFAPAIPEKKIPIIS